MPRSARKPYEHVRRVWHSERHKPMRGSLIQEIFRVVNEIHSTQTKKNKEWQEKLPIVVLKAEEILYSKAISEAEYLDLNTLWDRVNDAIDTIIRKDESTETEGLLQPCIEAALVLGCTPRRVSRSQQSNNPKCYLGASTSKPASVCPNNLANLGAFLSHDSDFAKHIPMNLTLLSSQTNNSICPRNNHNLPMIPTKFPPFGNLKNPSRETYTQANSSTAYPLFYGDPLESAKPQFCSYVPPNSIPHNSVPPESIVHRDAKDLDAMGCDLSLRLGPLGLGAPCTANENSRAKEVNGPYSSGEQRKLNSLTLCTSRELSFLPMTNAEKPLGLSSERSSEADVTNLESGLRKRKAIDQPMEDRQFSWQPQLRRDTLIEDCSNARFTGQLRLA